MYAIRIILSDWLTTLADWISPDGGEKYFIPLQQAARGFTPPASAESNARTKKRKAKRKRQLARLKAADKEQKLKNRAGSEIAP